MTLCRLIAPNWLIEENPKTKRVLEGKFTNEELIKFNNIGYNVYYLPNYPKDYSGSTVDGKDIDVFEYVFVDCDLKDGKYKSKEEFLEKITLNDSFLPSKIIDSGNGIHAYWRVTDLDAMSYLRFQRRLMRQYDTDTATGMIFQLMRLPGYNNTKVKASLKPCQELYADDTVYTSEQIDNLLPPIRLEDEEQCQQHYNITHGLNEVTEISGELPPKFGKLIKNNKEAADLFSSTTDDRSKNDYRLGHVMLGNGFTKEEAMNVLYNSAKAMQRAPSHRYNYAKNIVDKIWTYEAVEEKEIVSLSPTVRDLLSRGEETIKGTRFPCHRLVDDTLHGFRLGQVIGIVGGSGVGKTTLTLNMFLWFCANNPNYHHFFFSLEQPAGEIASRVRTICGDDESLFDKIHIISNYGDNGEFRNFSMKMIEDHMVNFEKSTKCKVGTAVIDHIGVLDKSNKNGENEGLIGVCKEMKGVAVRVNIMLLMLSQAPREKAGVGDLELDKNAAYGTVFFESYVDYLLCLWQPLKRVYSEGAPTIMALKFAKIRHKKQNQDRIQEDVRYQVFFDPTTERLREMTQEEETSATYFMNRAANARKADKKTDLVPYQSRRLDEDTTTTVNSNGDRSKH